MSQSSSPEEIQELLAGYVLNELDMEESAQVEQILADPAMAQAVQDLRWTLETAYAPPTVEPPPQLRDKVMQAFAAATEPTIPIATVPPVVLLPRWAKALGAVAAGVIVSLSISNYLLWRSLQTQMAQNSQTPIVLSLQPTQSPGTSVAVLVKVNPETLRGTLTIEKLPPLESGKVYVLWTVLTADAPFTTDEHNAILTQVFTVKDQGNQAHEIVLPSAFQNPKLVKAMAITIEDAAAPQQHKSSPILIQKL
ncbi:MAG: anti-sigma factor [Scytolyngbya sp. HA4215-MV1]|jgi:anti-sigma-K factor RskA|nr:anti-sigma factor [Scytolyngbya sp. HA4215-MV1]